MEKTELQVVVAVIAEAHKKQWRKGIFAHVPYVQHLFDVHKRVVHYLATAKDDKLEIADVVIQAAALMHDLDEDTTFKLKDIAFRFGELPAKLVGELSRPDSQGNTRADKYEWLKTYNEKSLESIVIKIADRVSNVNDYMADPTKQAYASFYALQAYPVYQAYLKYGGNNIRILDDIHAMNKIVRLRYPNVSVFADYAEIVVEKLMTASGDHGWK